MAALISVVNFVQSSKIVIKCVTIDCSVDSPEVMSVRISVVAERIEVVFFSPVDASE